MASRLERPLPKDWQETIHSAPNGERHIADVKTPGGVTLEFQHSFLAEAERQQRELFYPKLIWIVDGKRRIRDRAQFFASLRTALHDKPLVIPARVDDCALLRDWKESRVPVYFDFGQSDPADPLRFDAHTLWRLNPGGESGAAYLSPVAKSYLVEVYLNNIAFDEPFTDALNVLAESYRKYQALQHRPSTAFDRFTTGMRRARRRL